jgi:hypothetical protein
VEEHPTLGWIRADTPGIERVEHDVDQRVAFYKALRASARKTIFIFGIGMRRIASDLDSLASQLNDGIHIRVMCLDSTFVREQGVQKIYNSFFSEDLREDGVNSYLDQADRSIARLVEFIRKPDTRRAPGKIELRAYAFFPTTNMTCIDEYTSYGRMVFELATHGNMRITLPSLASGNPLFEKCRKLFDSYWTDGKVIARSRR